MDLNASAMIEFGSQGFVRPAAGVLRRCLALDDLHGVNFLYPWCGSPLVTPSCEEAY